MNQTKVVTPIIKKVVITTPGTKKSKATDLTDQNEAALTNKKSNMVMTEPRQKNNPIVIESESPTQKRIRKIIAPQFSLVGKKMSN